MLVRQGLLEAVLEQHIPASQRTTAMNNLLAKHRLKILQHPKDNSLVYQEVIQEDAAKCDSAQ